LSDQTAKASAKDNADKKVQDKSEEDRKLSQYVFIHKTRQVIVNSRKCRFCWKK